MIYGYIRVSSDKQTVENQRFEINNFCKRNSITIDGWKEILPTAGARMNVRERRDSYVHNRPSTCGTTNQDFRDAIRNRKDQW